MSDTNCKHDEWSDDPDCECTVNHCIACNETEVSIHATAMEELCARQEVEIAVLEARITHLVDQEAEIRGLEARITQLEEQTPPSHWLGKPR